MNADGMSKCVSPGRNKWDRQCPHECKRSNHLDEWNGIGADAQSKKVSVGDGEFV